MDKAPGVGGPCSKCSGCKENIDKQEKRIVHNFHKFPNHAFTTTEKFHCKPTCLEKVNDMKGLVREVEKNKEFQGVRGIVMRAAGKKLGESDDEDFYECESGSDDKSIPGLLDSDGDEWYNVTQELGIKKNEEDSDATEKMEDLEEDLGEMMEV